jgi:antigen flippase
MSWDGAPRDIMANGLHYRGKGRSTVIFCSELAWTSVYVALAWVCVSAFDLRGAGIAFFVSYIFHVFMIYVIVRRLTGFRWSSINIKVGLIFISTLSLVFLGFYELTYPVAMAVGICVLTASSIYSIRSLLNLVSVNRIPRSVMRMLKWLRLVEATVLDS